MQGIIRKDYKIIDYILTVKDNSKPRPYMLNPILKGFMELYQEHQIAYNTCD